MSLMLSISSHSMLQLSEDISDMTEVVE